MRRLLKGLIYLAIFSLVNIALISKDSEPFRALLSVAYPYMEAEASYSFVMLIFNVCVSLLFVREIIQSADQQFLTGDYLYVRAGRTKTFMVGLLRTLLTVLLVWCAKLAADFLLSSLDGAKNLPLALHTELSLLLSAVIWALLVYLLYMLRVQMKWIYFLTLFAIVAAQYLSAYIPAFTLFVAGSPAFRKDPTLWLSVKLALIAVFTAADIIAAKNYEHYSVKIEN